MFRTVMSEYGGVVMRKKWWSERKDGGKGRSFPPLPTRYFVSSDVNETISEDKGIG